MNGLADFHHIEFRVSNALQASYSYCCCFGFQRFAQRKDDSSTSIAIKNGKVIFVFTSIHFSNKENYEHMVTHGDSVKDVAFRVDDLSSLVKRLVNNNVDIIQAEDVLSEQEGKISIVKIRVKGSTLIHSLIEDGGYHGLFLPNFVPIDNYSLCKTLNSERLPMTATYFIDNWKEDSLHMSLYIESGFKITSP
uniref:VOC domain-containing protein n=1 Tax=Heterorhabditis bacteriophora TaxID=37862 RepID=A0A1I7XVK1_HETBA